jgi:hypothetical protein
MHIGLLLFAHVQHKHASEYAVAQQQKHDGVAATEQVEEDRLRRMEGEIAEL